MNISTHDPKRILGNISTVLLFLNCSAENPSIVGQDEVTTLDVREFGAVGNDELDDTEAFRAALAALPADGGSIIVPSGVYLLTASQPNPNRAIDLSERRNISIVGEDMDSSILKMAPATYSSATFIILVGHANGIVIQDLAIDANREDVVYNDEQSHGIEIMSSKDVTINRVRFENSGGDGVRLFGLTAADLWTEHITIENSHFRDATRNGISMQRAVRFVTIRNNRFERISDQSISAEPSGAGSPTDVLIEGNIVTHLNKTWAIGLAGVKPKDTMRRLTFRNNRIENGAAHFLWIDGLSVDGNTFLGDPYHSTMRLEDVRQVSVVRNRIEGHAEQGPGVVQLVNHNEPFSSMVTIQDNQISVTDGLTGIFVRDAFSDITITGNIVQGTRGRIGIHFTNIAITSFARPAIAITDNEIDNFSSGIALVTRGDEYEDVSITSNTIMEEDEAAGTIGILFDGTGPYETFAEVVSNVFGSGIEVGILVRGNGPASRTNSD